MVYVRRIAFLIPALLFAACGGGNGGNHLGNGGGTTGSNGGTTGGGGTTNPGSGGDTSNPGTGGTSPGTGGSVGTGGTSGGVGGGPGASVAVCDSYCTSIMATCTGVNQQYVDKDDCLKTCAYIPAGGATDATGQSIGCRANQVTAAAANTMATKSECWAAGPLGYGTCGSECDVFCGIALSACPGSFKSADDCNNFCNNPNLNRQLEFGMTGSYTSNFKFGTRGDTVTDTLECRTYELVDKVLKGMGASCSSVTAKSTDCGDGPAAIDLGDGGTTESDGPVATYDGGIGATITAANCNETLFPREKRRMILRDEGDPHLHLVDLGDPSKNWSTVAGGPWARAAQLIGNNQVLGGRNDGYEVFDLTTGKIVKTVTGFANTQSAYRMATGETMLTTSGTVLKFLGADDKVAHQISYPGYGYVRVARPTRNGTFLVPADQTVFEGDAKGNVIWKLSSGASGWGHIWEPILLGPPPAVAAQTAKWKSGDTLLCTAFGASCDIIDGTTHKVTYRYGTKQMPDAATIKPNFFSEFELLPNGNVLTSNWQGHGPGNGNSGIQVLEFDPTGKVVWEYKQDPKLFSSIQGVMMLDCKDPMKLHVIETSPDSTWQPVK
ncbi:MAG TPA: hypothetical protein VHJ20_15210 [Polyangia bacterium]|nr:hypothetical protein [Polyangia bacterium]